MKSRTSESNQEFQRPTFPVGPILQAHGGEPVVEDRGWRPYKCPYHGDRQASASVNTIVQAFNCHACEMKGDAIGLVMKEEGLDYSSAVTRCEEITGESNTKLRGSRGLGSSVSSRQRNRQGSRSFRRTWRSD